MIANVLIMNLVSITSEAELTATLIFLILEVLSYIRVLFVFVCID